MRVNGENGWIELLRRDDEQSDEAFDVRCAVGDFAGHNSRVWISGPEQKNFREALHVLERDRRGEASVAAMSAQEFELTVRVVDALGHASVAGLIGRGHHVGQSRDRLVLNFSFALDPTDLPALVREMANLMSAA